MFNSLKKYLYSEIYINIVQSSKHTNIYVEECSNRGICGNHEEQFNSSEKGDIYEYITKFINKSPVNYVIILDPSLSQGAAPTCNSQEIKKFCDLGEVEHICVDKSWAYYTSKLDLLEIQGRYKKTGLDFVFSPFYMLHQFFKDKIKNDIGLYVLVNEDYMALSVFEDSKLLFASMLDMQKDEESSDDLIMDVDDDEELILEDIQNNSVDLEDIDVDEEIEGLDELDEIDDLESFDDIDDFDVEEPEEDIDQISDKKSDDSAEDDSFGEDYQRFSLIQGAVNSFYKDSKYESKFLQNAYIADGVGLSGEFKRFLEEEMFLSVFIRKIDIAQELCELAKAEKK